MTDAAFEDIMESALRLSPAEQARLMERLAASLSQQLNELEKAEEDRWDAEEVAALMQPAPLSPTEVVEQGLTGTWSHLKIGDGAEWVNEQKRKRKARRKW